MKRLTCHIVLGKFEFDFVTEVEIESTWKRLTDTAKIVLPRKIMWKDKLLKDEIKRGDEVQVWLGWDFDNRLEFQGFVADVGSKIPVEIRCEDAMWKLKQTTITKSWKSVSLKQMLSEILPGGYTFKAVDVELGRFRINRVSVAKALESLREIFGLYAFFKEGILFVGFPYSLSDGTEAAFGFERDIIDDDLVYVKEDDLKIRVVATSVLPDGSQIEVPVGDNEGETHTLHYFDKTAAELGVLANEDLKLLRYTGFRGDFETFGAPFVRHTDVAVLEPGIYQERGGKYFIDKTTARFGVDGFRRRIELGRQA